MFNVLSVHTQTIVIYLSLFHVRSIKCQVYPFHIRMHVELSDLVVVQFLQSSSNEMKISINFCKRWCLFNGWCSNTNSSFTIVVALNFCWPVYLANVTIGLAHRVHSRRSSHIHTPPKIAIMHNVCNALFENGIVSIRNEESLMH